MQEIQGTQVRPPGWGEPLEKGMATHTSVLAWRIPMDRGPGGLQSMDQVRLHKGRKWSRKEVLNYLGDGALGFSRSDFPESAFLP